MTSVDKIPLGVSACLLGHTVRYDGGHQHDRYLSETLGEFFEFIPVCPEVECGLPVPRESMRLVGDIDAPRLVTTKTEIDHTDRMTCWARGRLDELAAQGVGGFIFKSKSPSSGMERVKVWGTDGTPKKRGVGIFAQAFIRRFPLVPVEEDGRLHDSNLRENFIEAVFLYQRWRHLLSDTPSRGGVVDFHTRHKLLIMAHDEKIYRQLGRLVAHSKDLALDTLLADYEQQMMTAMRLQATAKKHSNVLMHMMGYFKKIITSGEKQELLAIIEQYRANLLPLIVPVALINHYVDKYQEPYLARQYYLHTHSLKLKFRNPA